jgi:hypothetical protein
MLLLARGRSANAPAAPLQAVESFYQRLVQGRACLSDLGCTPAGQALLGPGWQERMAQQVRAPQALPAAQLQNSH